MIEIILTIASAITASGIVGGAGVWIGKTFKSYINERDRFRDEIQSLQAQAVSQDATIKGQNTTIVALQEQVLAQVRVTDQQDATITKQDATIARLEATIRGLEETVTKLEATIKELTRDKAAAERQRDAALRGDEPETGEHSRVDPSAAAGDDLGGVSIPKRQGAD